MGTNNRQRRRAKKIQRERRGDAGRGRTGSSYAPPHRGHAHEQMSDAELVRGCVLAAAEAFRFVDDREFEKAFERLCWLRERVGYGAVDEAVTWWVDLATDRLWNEGWQPADVVRVLGRKLGADVAVEVTDRIAASAARRREAGADHRWAAQLDGLREAARPASAAAPAWEQRLHAAVRAVSLLLYLPPLPKLGCSPTSSRRRRGAGGAVLERVRALLAKAESTSFPDEADAFTAKAQELMARHAIDEAMLADGDGDGPATVVGWRIAVDDPYASPKSLLLHGIARTNRCRSVFCGDMGLATVFGTEADLEVVELLFTSLLLQGTEAMMRAGRSVDRSGRSRTRSFRQSFLVAFAVRVGERLDAVTKVVVAEGEAHYGDALLPVLASRERAVEEAVTRAFPETVSRGVAVANGAGYAAGRAAAEIVSLAVGEALPVG